MEYLLQLKNDLIKFEKFQDKMQFDKLEKAYFEFKRYLSSVDQTVAFDKLIANYFSLASYNKNLYNFHFDDLLFYERIQNKDYLKKLSNLLLKRKKIPLKDIEPSKNIRYLRKKTYH